MTTGCHFCSSTTEELRPYGPGGSSVCFDCATATPEREAAATAAYSVLLDAAASVGGGVATIGGEDGPRPGFNPGEERA